MVGALRRIGEARDDGDAGATRQGDALDLPDPRIPRKLLLVRPTGKRKGSEPNPPQAENHLPIPSLEGSGRLRLDWELPPLLRFISTAQRISDPVGASI
ncbi:hypothetical protein GCM10007198_20040 [Microbacterium aerolatum]|uniref:Uncharacterized protein n=1 Tax=Microbacterium aerolatum TaxID=153731 RepID=A0A511AGU5_9MICO|nr:hypothetical protein MAE01_04230 [Microbacterium aerolatum]GGB29644.1 hypothetical protein GCM10007198_20040 [Microbacterium aerolatum]